MASHKQKKIKVGWHMNPGTVAELADLARNAGYMHGQKPAIGEYLDDWVQGKHTIIFRKVGNQP